MDHGDEPERESGDQDYPVAPLPPHERVWRHPSELGTGEMMVVVDPPPVLSKGMAIGAAVLALVFVAGLTRLMVPGDGASDIAVSVTAAAQRVTLPLVSEATDAPQGSPVSTVATFTSTTAVLGPPATFEIVPSTTLVPIPETTVASTPVTVTMAPTTVATATTSVSTTVPPPRTALVSADAGEAVAIEVQRGVLYVTTSAAVGTARSAPVVLDDGSTVEADVMIVDETAGIAVLVVTSDPAGEMTRPSLPTTDSDALPGDAVTVMADKDSQTAGVLGTEASETGGVELLYDEGTMSIGEGAPVLDDEGNLVGLCTESGERTWVVPASALVEAIEASLSIETSAPWLGISGSRGDDGGVLVSAVVAGSPAEVAGVAVGDMIIGFDGHTVLSMSELAFDMAGHEPGDQIMITVQRSGEAIELLVELGVRPAGA